MISVKNTLIAEFFACFHKPINVIIEYVVRKTVSECFYGKARLNKLAAHGFMNYNWKIKAINEVCAVASLDFIHIRNRDLTLNVTKFCQCYPKVILHVFLLDS